MKNVERPVPSALQAWTAHLVVMDNLPGRPDRGSQHTSEQADHGIICSMSDSGNVWDNAAMESFFSSVK
jgi:hypothetical protein